VKEAAPQVETLFRTKYLALVSSGKWQWVSRPNAVVCIVGLTDDDEVLLIEQFRTPVNARVIEWPAGLVGDDAATTNEPLVEAAKRELLEETGYNAAEMQEAFCGVTSAGLTDEATTFFVAKGLSKVQETTGVDGEDIQQHRVPLHRVDAWLAERQQAGTKIDARILAGLYLLRRYTALR
jgi:ADP-ribose pyrophosphatase